MYSFKDDIFDLCTETERVALSMFCNEINNSKADIFVVMAHKAVQLLQVLIAQGHITENVSNKTIISNHALDYECTYLLDKNIAIIDDILISGTSISYTVNKLISIGVSQNSISIITLAVDKKYFSMDFMDDSGNSALYCNKELNDDICIALSYKISKIFSEYGLPYNVDFPSYNPFVLSRKSVNGLYNNLFWETNEVSNSVHTQNNINVLILFPKEQFKNIIWKRIGINLEHCTHIKIRTFLINYPNGKIECQLIPMCLFHEISESDLRAIFDVCNSLDVSFNNNECIAKMRYLEYYIAHQIYLAFLEITSFCYTKIPTRTSIELLFGIETGNKIYNNINNTSFNKPVLSHVNISPFYAKAEILNEYYKSDIRKQAAINFTCDNSIVSQGFSLNIGILYPFKWWYETKEIPIREQFYTKPRHYVKSFKEIKDCSQRLNSGFSLKNIEILLKDNYKNYDLEPVISLFIDRSIDEGILVPTIYHDKVNGYVCRAFRHGEDLPFALEDQYRLLFFLRELYNKIPSINYSSKPIKTEGISDISFEKIIVLFFQMGLKKGYVFNRFLGFDNSLYIKSFLSLHGVVKGIIKPEDEDKTHIYSEKSDNGEEYIQWITSWLIKNNYVFREEIHGKEQEHICCINYDKIKDYLIKNEYGSISDDIKHAICDIASIISTWYNSMINSEKKRAFKDDVTALTSCANQYVFASAIATEIHYFSNFWNNQAKNALSKYDKSKSIIALIEEKEEDKKQNKSIIQGLNSGRDKIEWYYNHRASRVIKKVSNILSSKGNNDWVQLWDAERTSVFTPVGANSSEIEKYTAEAICYLYFFSSCYDCLVHADFWISGDVPSKFFEYEDLFNNYANNHFFDIELFTKLRTIGSNDDFNSKKEQFIALIESIRNYSEDCVDNIEESVKENDKNYSIQYYSSLILELDAINSSVLENTFLKVWEKQDSDDKVQINIVKFPDEITKPNYIKYGIFCGISSIPEGKNIIKNGKILLGFYHDLCNELNAKVYDIRGILIPHTPPGRMFKFNTRKNINEYLMRFNEKNCKDLEKNFINNTKQQLIVAMTNYVEQIFLDIVEQLNWDSTKEINVQPTAQVFTQILVFYNKFIHHNNIGINDYSYSVVKIKNGSKIGAGFLFKYKNEVVCITCNHLCQEYINDKTIYAISEYDEKYSFSLSPIKPIINFDYKKGVLSAKKEVAVLSPQWGGKIPYDLKNIISIDNLNLVTEQYLNEPCTCLGFPSENVQCWSDPMQVHKRINYGYYQTNLPKSNGKVCEGYSGGIVTIDNNNNCLIGMHEGRFGDDNGRLIPCSEIIESLEVINYDESK